MAINEKYNIIPCHQLAIHVKNTPEGNINGVEYENIMHIAKNYWYDRYVHYIGQNKSFICDNVFYQASSFDMIKSGLNDSIVVVQSIRMNATEYLNKLNNDPSYYISSYHSYRGGTIYGSKKGNEEYKLDIKGGTFKYVILDQNKSLVTESKKTINHDDGTGHIDIKEYFYAAAGTAACVHQIKALHSEYAKYCSIVPILDLGMDYLGVSNKYFFSSFFISQEINKFVSSKIPEKTKDLLSKITGLEKREVAELDIYKALPLMRCLQGSALELDDDEPQVMMKALSSQVEAKNSLASELVHTHDKEFNDMVDKVIDVASVGVSIATTHFIKPMYDYTVDTLYVIGEYTDDYFNNTGHVEL